MPKPLTTETQSILSPTSQMSFAVAVCALAAAGIGTIVNHWLTGWMAVGGMVGVGLFYTAVGLLNLRTRHPIYENGATMSERMARVDNLVGEPIARPQLGMPNTSDERNLRVRHDESGDDDKSEASRQPRSNA